MMNKIYFTPNQDGYNLTYNDDVSLVVNPADGELYAALSEYGEGDDPQDVELDYFDADEHMTAINVIEFDTNEDMLTDAMLFTGNNKAAVTAAAEDHFSKCASENGCGEDDLRACLEDGYYDEGHGYYVCITWPNQRKQDHDFS